MIKFRVQLFPYGVQTVVDASDVIQAVDFAVATTGRSFSYARVDHATPHKHSITVAIPSSDRPRPLTHFVGFRDPQQVANAARIWGYPDIVHFVWDQRAMREVDPSDLLVFAKFDPDAPSLRSHDDSNEPDDPAARERISGSKRRTRATYLPV
jgi:hypothetical protein